MSIEYFQGKDRSLSFHLNTDQPVLLDAQKAEINRHWEEVSAKNPNGLFNGQIYSCSTFVDNDGQLQIGVNRSDYKTYKWARDGGHRVPGAYVMGNCMFLYDPESDAYVLVERSSKVAFDKSKISGVGGVIDYAPVDMGKFEDYLESEVVREADEEVVLEGGLRDVKLLGLYRDTVTNKVELAYTGTAVVKGVAASENKKVIRVSPKEIVQFSSDERQRLEESTGNHLDHVAQKLSELHSK